MSSKCSDGKRCEATGARGVGTATFCLLRLAFLDTYSFHVRTPSYSISYLRERSRDNAQLLFNQIFSIEAERLEVGPVVSLPVPEFRVPREKPMPKKKELTRWQKYAQEKGIQNRKRDRMVWDETSQSVSARACSLVVLRCALTRSNDMGSSVQTTLGIQANQRRSKRLAYRGWAKRRPL